MKEMFSAKSHSVIQIHDALQTGEVSSADRRIVFDKRSTASAIMGQNKTADFKDLIRDASKAYNISSDIKDYLVVPVPTILTEVPNKNGVAFPKESLTDYSPDHGCKRYKTWIGKPTFYEHNNKDHTQAKGLILDSVLNPIKNYPGFYKVVKLLAFDRTKDTSLFHMIASGKINSYSMGAYVGVYSCSLCGAAYKAEAGFSACPHIHAKKTNFYISNQGRLVYKNLHDIVGFETSAVLEPAYVPAISDYPSAMDPRIGEAYG